jgi:hypothetical protein
MPAKTDRNDRGLANDAGPRSNEGVRPGSLRQPQEHRRDSAKAPAHLLARALLDYRLNNWPQLETCDARGRFWSQTVPWLGVGNRAHDAIAGGKGEVFHRNLASSA